MPPSRDISELEAVRAACLAAARAAYDDALMRGICAEGALEAALGAIEMLDLDELSDNEKKTPDR